MEEKRGFVRLSVSARAEYTLPGKAPKDVELADLGARGMRIVCKEQFPEAQVLKMVLKIPGISGDIRGEGKVVWQRKLGRDVFDTGIEFAGLEDDGEERLIRFIEGIAGNLHEKREYVRCRIKTQVRYQVLDGDAEEKTCESVDVCAAGLKILTAQKLEKGTRLKVSFVQPEDKSEIIARCTVVAWFKKSESDLFETGIEFLEISEADREKIKNYVRRQIQKE